MLSWSSNQMDLLRQSKLRTLVVDSLLAIGGKQRGEHIVLTCPWHNETKPSLHVNIGYEVDPGVFNCFGCKAKGSWNVLAKALKLPTIEENTKDKTITVNGISTQNDEDDTQTIKKVYEEIQAKIKATQAEYPTLKTSELPDDFFWRGYGKKFYEKLGGRFYWNRKFDKNYLYFPLTMNKRYTGYTLCSLDGKDVKYQTFTDSSKVFFLYDHIPYGVPIVLVEGHFDAIRLYAEGFYPLGIFGVQNWSSIKMNYLTAKAPPKVVIAFDGDKPGCDAAVKVFKDLRIGFNVDIFYLPISTDPKNKIDPGNMSEEFIWELRKKIE